METPRFKTFKEYLFALVDSTLSDEEKAKRKKKKNRNDELPTAILKYLRHANAGEK